jgi:hypothetical protein
MTVSTDGGRTFGPLATPPDHLVATLPYQYLGDTVPSGIRQPSNLNRHSDGFFYLFGSVIDPPAQRQWVCAMRTDDLANPSAWRYWDGSGFVGEWLDPYREDTTPRTSVRHSRTTSSADRSRRASCSTNGSTAT